MRSYWSRSRFPGGATLAGATALTLTLFAAVPSAARAQGDELDSVCAGGLTGPVAECYLAAAAVRLIHPRVGTGLWGGSPMPGSASTLGMRLGSLPRLSTSGRLIVVPMELPPLTDRSVDDGSRALAAGLSGQTTIGLLPGWSPLPTVGGFMSLDGAVRASWLLLPGGQGFDQGSVLGASLGLRLGLLRESFTLPGISVTGSYGRSTNVTFGDPQGSGDGHIQGAVAHWGLAGTASKRVGPVGVTAGATLDRYTSAVEFSYRGAPLGGQRADAATDRFSVFGNVSWTFLILHAALEAGWQESPVPEGIPSSVSLDPTGWWAGLAIRLSI